MSLSLAEKKAWLESSGQQRCALFELTFLGAAVGSPSEAQEYKVYISNGPYATGPLDTPPNQEFEDCVLELPPFTRRMGEQLNGRSTQSYGDLLVANGNIVDGQVVYTGERSTWLTMNWDGRRIRQWIGAPWWPFDDFILVLDGAIDDVFDPGGSRIGFKISDKAALLDRPIITTLLGGPGPEADKLAPYALGSELINIKPVPYDMAGTHGQEYRISLVDAGGIIEQLLESDHILTVYEDRRPLTSTGAVTAVNTGTDRATVADHGLFAKNRIRFFSLGFGLPGGLSGATDYWVLNPTTNDFQVEASPGGGAIDLTSAPGGDFGYEAFAWTPDYANGGFWLAGNPSGLITCDLNAGLKVYVSTDVMYSPGDIIQQVLTSRLTNTPFTIADIDTANFAAAKSLLAGISVQVSYYLTEQTTFTELFDQLMLSVGGWWGFSREGLLQIGRLDLPVGGSPVYEYIPDDLALRSMKLQRRILPRAEIKLLASRNWTQQTVFAEDVSQDVRAVYSRPGIIYTGTATVLDWRSDPTSHLNVSRPDVAETFLADGGAAEALRRAALYQFVTGVWSFLTHQSAYLFEIGQELSIVHPKYTGNGVVVGISERLKGGRCELQFFAAIVETYPTTQIPPPGAEPMIGPELLDTMTGAATTTVVAHTVDSGHLLDDSEGPSSLEYRLDGAGNLVAPGDDTEVVLHYAWLPTDVVNFYIEVDFTWNTGFVDEVRIGLEIGDNLGFLDSLIELILLDPSSGSLYEFLVSADPDFNFETNPITVSTGAEHTLRLERVGSTFTAKLDGATITTYTTGATVVAPDFVYLKMKSPEVASKLIVNEVRGSSL